MSEISQHAKYKFLRIDNIKTKITLLLPYNVK